MEIRQIDTLESTLDESVYDTLVIFFGYCSLSLDARHKCHLGKSQDCVFTQCGPSRRPETY